MCEIGENEYELTADRASSRINNVCHKSFSRPKAVRGSRSQKNFGICGGRRNRQETPSQKVGLPTHFSFYKNETILALELTFCSILIMEKFHLILLFLRKIRRGPKLEGCAFAKFGNSSGTEEEPSQKRE